MLQTHYKKVVHNVSTEELLAGRRSYEDIRRTYDEGRQQINKNNILKLMHSFWHRDLKPLPVPPDHLLRFMLETGAYIPAPVWCYSSQGKGLDYNRFQAMWSLVRDGVERADIRQVRQIFFEYRESDLDLATDGLWSGSFVTAVNAARGLRAANEASTSDGPEPQGLVGPAGNQDIFPETESQGQEPDLPEISMHDLADLSIAEDDQVDEDAELYDSD